VGGVGSGSSGGRFGNGSRSHGRVALAPRVEAGTRPAARPGPVGRVRRTRRGVTVGTVGASRRTVGTRLPGRHKPTLRESSDHGR
jgi:hypothetical protein